MHLKNRNILITGASGGLGEYLAREVARVGARPVLVARREDQLARVATEIKEETGIVCPTIACDITRPEDRARMGDFVREEIGELSILVHNAGITMHGPFDGSSPEALRRVMELNFFAVVEVTRALLSVLMKTPGPKRIVLVSTPSGLYGVRERFGYGASKAASQSFLESISHDLESYGIDTAIFYPGYVRTSLRTSGISAAGDSLSEEQARQARSPGDVARMMRRALESDRRRMFSNFTGRFVYYARVLAPRLLDHLIRKRYGES